MLNVGNGVLLIALFGGVAGLNYTVDPYNAFGPNAGRWSKQLVVAKNQQVLWTLAAFSNRPSSHVLIGDSRMALLDPAAICSKFGVEYANLATGGATIAEMVTTFKRVAAQHELKNVAMNVAFSHFNRALDTNRVPESEALLDQPLRYLFDPRISTASLGVLRYAVTGQGGATFRPPLDRQAFWKFQVDVTARNQFQNYEFNEARYVDLLAVRGYCRAHDIRLTLVVFPEHGDWRRRIDDFGKRAACDEFFRRLHADFDRVVDFHGRADWENKSRYGDPAHFSGREQGAIIAEVFATALQ